MHDERVPARRLADRLRHADQHEHERGARQPRLASCSAATRGEGRLVHPNDDVNRGQSSNDVFPTAMHVAAVEARSCIGSIPPLEGPARRRSRPRPTRSPTSSRSAAPTCRTRRRSRSARSSPATSSQLDHGLAHVADALPHLCELALGGTAVGHRAQRAPGVRRPGRGGARRGSPGSRSSPRRTSSRRSPSNDALVLAHGALKTLAAVADQDRQRRALARLRARGPASGEISIPENEPGSSIMPGQGQPDPVRGADDGSARRCSATTSRSTSAAPRATSSSTSSSR